MVPCSLKALQIIVVTGYKNCNKRCILYIYDILLAQFTRMLFNFDFMALINHKQQGRNNTQGM